MVWTDNTQPSPPPASTCRHGLHLYTTMHQWQEMMRTLCFLFPFKTLGLFRCGQASTSDSPFFFSGISTNAQEQWNTWSGYMLDTPDTKQKARGSKRMVRGFKSRPYRGTRVRLLLIGAQDPPTTFQMSNTAESSPWTSLELQSAFVRLQLTWRWFLCAAHFTTTVTGIYSRLLCVCVFFFQICEGVVE